MSSIKSTLQSTFDILKDVARCHPTPIYPNPELPQQLPSAEQLETIDKSQKIKKTPLVALWPDDQLRPNDSDREAPYVTRGRYAEINRLSELIENLPRAIHLITGPPGYGKSTMLRTIVEYAVRRGFLPVRIKPKAFLNPITVIEQIRRQTLGAALAGSRLDLEHKQDITDETHVGGTIAFAEGGHKRAVTNSQTQQRHQEGSPELLHHLQEICAVLNNDYTHIRGILIYCDEFQKLHKYSPESTDEHLTLSDQIYTLNEELRSNVPPLPVITLLAGISPAHETLQNLLSRKSVATTIELLPVDGYPVPDPRSPHCTLILHDYFTASRRALGHNFHIPLAQLHIWGMECRGHVLHANHAGTAIQRQLEEFTDAGKQQLTPEDFTSIDEAIRDQREAYYDDRFESIYSNMPEETTKEEILDVTAHVIVAIHHHKPTVRSPEAPYFLTWNTIWEIATQALADKNKTKADKILEHLQNKGIISHMRKDGRFLHYKAPKRPPRGTIDKPPSSPMPYVDCPIPTLSEHIRNTIPPVRMKQIQATIEQTVQQQAYLASTQWDWAADLPLMKITEVKPLDYVDPVFPRVFTPWQAREAANILIEEIQRDPDAQNPFMHQCVQDLRRHYGLVHDNHLTLSDEQHEEAEQQPGMPVETCTEKS